MDCEVDRKLPELLFSKGCDHWHKVQTKATSGVPQGIFSNDLGTDIEYKFTVTENWEEWYTK